MKKRNPPTPSQSPPTSHIINFDNEDLRIQKDILTLDASFLTANSETTRKALENKKRGLNNVPRPPNSYFIYMRDTKEKIRNLPEYIGMKEHDLTTEVAKKWKEEPESIKDTYRGLADVAKKRHQELHQDYKFKPDRSRKRIKTDKEHHSSGESDDSLNHFDNPSPTEDTIISNIDINNIDIRNPVFSYYVN